MLSSRGVMCSVVGDGGALLIPYWDGAFRFRAGGLQSIGYLVENDVICLIGVM